MNWRRVAQLTMVHVGVSITVVPVTSTLNRIMISDMKLSAFLVSILIALPYLLSPLQVAVGNWADHYPLWGRHRSPWIVIGGLMAAFGSYFTAHAAYRMDDNFWLGLGMAIAVFAVWGLGVNMASVSYLSLVSELSGGSEGWRSRAVSIMWTVMIISTIATSIGLSRMLDPFSLEMLYTSFGVVWLISCILILFGAMDLEPARSKDTPAPQNSADNPLLAFQLLSNNSSARRFFCYLVLVLVSIHAQDVLLEPYGADILKMSVAATSRLTALWGVGVFITLLGGGLFVVRRIGKKRSANIGAVVAAIAFSLIIVSGLLQRPDFFRASIFLLGLGGGLMTVSNLSFMLEMTAPQAAGLYIGAWGVANFAGQALGNIASGAIRDAMLWLTGDVVAGYVSVFGLEVLGLLVAIWLFRTISVDEFRRDAEVQVHDVLALAVDSA